MKNTDTASKEPSNKPTKIAIVNALPSPDYQPTVRIALLHVMVGRKLKSTTVIQRYDSTVPGHEPVWMPLPAVVAMQEPQLIVLPGASRN
jgi:hypothetical protein